MGGKVLVAQANVNTGKAVAYLKKFCRHFSHKLPTEFDDNNGRVEFPFGNCTLETQGDQLKFRLESESEEHLAKLEEVVVKHMERFAFRDNITMNWDRL